jgi:branched-chain amino acid transport system ATP-binding protein
MLAIARALMSAPRLLLLDEPTLGLAPRLAAQILGDLCELRDAGTTVLLVEQSTRAALGVADRAYLIERGAVVLDGPAEVLAAHPRVLATYLGGDAPAAGRIAAQVGAPGTVRAGVCGGRSTT